jgi:hypothetical protein
VRWRRLEAEYAGTIEVRWKSYLLRPAPQESGDPVAALEKFRRYTQSWLRVAADPDAGEFHLGTVPGTHLCRPRPRFKDGIE